MLAIVVPKAQNFLLTLQNRAYYKRAIKMSQLYSQKKKTEIELMGKMLSFQVLIANRSLEKNDGRIWFCMEFFFKPCCFLVEIK